MPANLCGIFIGKSGRNVSALKRQTNTEIKIGREPVMAYFRYCTVEGTLAPQSAGCHVVQRDREREMDGGKERGRDREKRGEGQGGRGGGRDKEGRRGAEVGERDKG